MEDAGGKGLMSVSSMGTMVLGSGKIAHLIPNIFSLAHKDSNRFAISLDRYGITRCNAAEWRKQSLESNDDVLVHLGVGGALNVSNGNQTYPTHFNHRGNNCIRPVTGGTHNFAFGKKRISTIISTYITINGKKVKHTLEQLESRINTFENKDYVSYNSELYLRNTDNSKLLKKAKGTTDAINSEGDITQTIALEDHPVDR